MTAQTCETLSVREAAARIGISYDKTLDLIKAKKLHAKWLGNKYRVPLTAIATFLDSEDAA